MGARVLRAPMRDALSLRAIPALMLRRVASTTPVYRLPRIVQIPNLQDALQPVERAAICVREHRTLPHG